MLKIGSTYKVLSKRIMLREANAGELPYNRNKWHILENELFLVLDEAAWNGGIIAWKVFSNDKIGYLTMMAQETSFWLPKIVEFVC